MMNRKTAYILGGLVAFTLILIWFVMSIYTAKSLENDINSQQNWDKIELKITKN